MNATLKQLETFRVFTQTRSVTETARLTRISQPAISLCLREVEKQFGFSIYHRVNGRIILTPEATQILPDVERLLGTFRSLQGRVGELRDVRGGSISIMCNPTLAIELLPRAISSFRAQRPNVRFSVDVTTHSEVTRKVREEYFDLGFVFLPTNEPGVATEPLIKTEVVCVMPIDHPLGRRNSISPRDLATQNVVLVRNDSVLMSQVAESMGTLKDDMSLIETNQTIAALHIIRHGGGIGVLHPFSLSPALANKLCIRPFEPQVELSIGLVFSRRRPMSRMLAKFISCVKVVSAEYSASLNDLGVSMSVLA